MGQDFPRNVEGYDGIYASIIVPTLNPNDTAYLNAPTGPGKWRVIKILQWAGAPSDYNQIIIIVTIDGVTAIQTHLRNLCACALTDNVHHLESSNVTLGTTRVSTEVRLNAVYKSSMSIGLRNGGAGAISLQVAGIIEYGL